MIDFGKVLLTHARWYLAVNAGLFVKQAVSKRLETEPGWLSSFPPRNLRRLPTNSFKNGRNSVQVHLVLIWAKSQFNLFGDIYVPQKLCLIYIYIYLYIHIQYMFFEIGIDMMKIYIYVYICICNVYLIMNVSLITLDFHSVIEWVKKKPVWLAFPRTTMPLKWWFVRTLGETFYMLLAWVWLGCTQNDWYIVMDPMFLS